MAADEIGAIVAVVIAVAIALVIVFYLFKLLFKLLRIIHNKGDGKRFKHDPSIRFSDDIRKSWRLFR